MVTFYVTKDYETPENSGAGGFQISTVRFLGGGEIDVTNAINVGTHFSDEVELKNYLAGIFKTKDVEVVE